MRLSKLFKNEQEGAVVAKIIEKVNSTLCVVQDNKGRQFTVESDGTYIVGQTVLIKSGIIVARKKKSKSSIYFNV